ncbi:hypothetical protein PHYPSEUDO_002554 [Phytophthora pseudosyringae]|uniref:Peptidase C1A papain C-terminal domain-containing protein n=1 Tax=Phytophthora pseudosyringae TaxID=221518 RepID=A0A8T1VST7_9STRA|nr:hypothetical protein PHYPSEUDO_002554 [Phytophthora pseudosyringae]
MTSGVTPSLLLPRSPAPVSIGKMLRVLASVALLLSAASAAPLCARTWRNREHLRPSVRALPPLTEAEALELRALPGQLDWCARGLCTPSWNQHIPRYCGSCFAHGALSAAQDRIKMLHKARGHAGPDVQLSRQTFLNCGPAHGLSDGCGGGEPSDVFEFMHHYGLPDETCVPYSATDYRKYTETNGTCPPEGYCMNCITTPDHPQGPHCFPVKTVVRYRAKEYGRVSGEHAMMKELLNGPITCGVACSDEFTFNYSAGVFHDKSGFLDIDHDVEVVGWGEEADGTKFWNVRNSWGTYWGMKGFFKIVRGVNNLGIEADCHWVRPDISDEELVFSQTTPLYGGSLWGIVPFAKGAATSHPINTTADVVLSNLPLQSEELPADTVAIIGHQDEETPMETVSLRMTEKTAIGGVEQVAGGQNASIGLSLFALLAAFVALGTVISNLVTRFSRSEQYNRLI